MSINIEAIKVTNTPICEVQPYEKNPRKNDDAVDVVVQSMKRYGWQGNPIIIDEEGVIVCGHTRYKAALKLGLTHVPTAKAIDLPPELIKEFRLVDNKTNEVAEWDMALLSEELDGIDFDMGEFGFEKITLQAEEPYEDDFNIEQAMPTEPITKPGDIWTLGSHRLMCGSATDPVSVGQLMNTDVADLIITDPPYNVDYTGGTHDKLKIMNDKMKADDFRRFLHESFANMFASIKRGGAAYVFHADSEGYNFRGAFCDAGFKLAQTCIWVKNGMVMGRQDYQWQHEPIMCGDKPDDEFQPVLYGWNPLSKHTWHSDRRQKTVWFFDKPQRNTEHPTMKPILLVAHAMKNSSAPGQIVIDLFGGSGSTLIAAEQLGRRCYMMELDPKYCDVIIKRWESLTGEKAELCK